MILPYDENYGEKEISCVASDRARLVKLRNNRSFFTYKEQIIRKIHQKERPKVLTCHRNERQTPRID